MELPPVSRPVAVAALCFGLVISAGLAAEEAPFDLPKYMVTGERELPPPEQWHYAHIEGFELLSSAPGTITRDLINDLQEFSYALDIVWPGVRQDFGVPCLVVVCGRFGEFARFQPEAQADIGLEERFLNIRDSTQAGIVLDQTIIREPRDLLHRNYVQVLLSGLARKPAPWLIEGLSRLIASVHVTENSITIGKVSDPQGLTEAGGDFNVVLEKGALLPMSEFFSRPAGTAVVVGSSEARWAAQCFAFVHWGLYGEAGRHQKAFLKFIMRLQRETLSEALFKDCFEQSYADMLFTLRSYVENTRHKMAGMKAEKGQKIPFPPPVTPRAATQAEIARITGDVLGLAGRPADARATYLTAYRRGEREPALLAALGQAELSAGDEVRARKLLEAAIAGDALRPQAYVALARLRLAAARARPEAAGKLSVRQTAGVLEPLFTVRRRPPALPETYELIAAAWAASSSSPSPAHLAVLDEGVRLFPRNAALVYADAELQAKAGQVATADSLIRHGLRVTADAGWREKFAQLRAGLPPLPVTPTKG